MDTWYQRAVRIPTVPTDPAWKLINRNWPNGGWTVQNERAGWTVRVMTTDYLEHVAAADFLDANNKLLKTYVFEDLRDIRSSKFKRTFKIIEIMFYANGYGTVLKLENDSNDGSNIDVGDFARAMSVLSIRYGLGQDEYEILYAPRKGE